MGKCGEVCWDQTEARKSKAHAWMSMRIHLFPHHHGSRQPGVCLIWICTEPGEQLESLQPSRPRSSALALASGHRLSSHAGPLHGALLLDSALCTRTKVACRAICETRLVRASKGMRRGNTMTVFTVSFSFRSYRVSATLWNEQKSEAASKPEPVGAC